MLAERTDLMMRNAKLGLVLVLLSLGLFLNRVGVLGHARNPISFMGSVIFSSPRWMYRSI